MTEKYIQISRDCKNISEKKIKAVLRIDNMLSHFTSFKKFKFLSYLTIIEQNKIEHLTLAQKNQSKNQNQNGFFKIKSNIKFEYFYLYLDKL